jgi:hypothetical protein
MKKQILALLGILLTVVSVTPNSVYATANPPKQVVVAKIQAAFPDAPIMVAVADCESGLLHYDNGLPRKNEKGSSATGLFQIMSSLHRADAKRLGYDIDTLEGNIAYARVLYKRRGTADWNPSKACWSKRSIKGASYSHNRTILPEENLLHQLF